MLARSCFRFAPSERLARAVSRTVAALQPGDLLFVDEPRQTFGDLDKAIDCVGSSTIQWLEARGRVVAQRDTAIHVALVQSSGNDASVIDAYRGIGVRRIALPLFLKQWSPQCRIYHGRLQGVGSELSQIAADFAEGKVGLNYCEKYSPPDAIGEAYYCSSLVDYAFRFALQKTLVFTCEPFKLIFEPHDFWEDYFRKRQQVLPSCYGSNPTLLLHSPCVKYYETALGAFAASRNPNLDQNWEQDMDAYMRQIADLSECASPARVARVMGGL